LSSEDRALLGSPQGRPLAGEALDSAADELGSEMRCPVCQGLSIVDSPASSAVSMLSLVRELFTAGYSREQILGYFESRYGEFVRLTPRAEGVNLIVWLGPVVALLLGAVVLFRLRRRQSDTETDDDPTLEGYLDRVRSESSAAPESR